MVDPSSDSNAQKNEDAYCRFLSFGQHVYYGNVADYQPLGPVPTTISGFQLMNLCSIEPN